MAKRTPDETRALLAGLGERLTHEVQSIQSSADFIRWLKLGARFHQYSMRNSMLILMQRPDATRCASFTTWRSMGRMVKKGEHGIAIYGPPTGKAIRDSNDEVVGYAKGRP